VGEEEKIFDIGTLHVKITLTFYHLSVLYLFKGGRCSILDVHWLDQSDGSHFGQAGRESSAWYFTGINAILSSGK